MYDNLSKVSTGVLLNRLNKFIEERNILKQEQINWFQKGGTNC